MECTVCSKRIRQGDKYYKSCEQVVEKFIEEEKDKNIFCSKKCFCEYLSLIEDENDEEEIYESEDHDCEYDPYREEC